MFKLIARISFALVALSFLAACNTMEGLGEDMQSGGKKLENKAEQNK